MKKNRITLDFKDSLLLLPSSLKALAEGFGVECKGDFNHALSDRCTTDAQFEMIRDELLAYNKQDCLVLYQVLEKFSKLIFDMFQVNISGIPTISSLALQIYRSNFMPEDARIGITDVKLYDKLHAAYMGGAVDVYTPQSEPMHSVYCYDVNSMYPAVMRDMDYPVGSPTFFEGSVDLNDHNTFGFLRVQVTSPKDLFAPLLMTRVGGRTVAPLGSWTGWYFSEELKFAATLGYKFEVREAVLYERGKIFKGYVDSLYKLRKKYSAKDPQNLICKLHMNSLYGRFGMSPRMEKYQLVDSNDVLTRLPANQIDLSEDKSLISYDVIRNQDVTAPDGNYLDISLPISMAVTAYARIYMQASIAMDGIMYTDTDSIHTTNKLPDSLVGPELGQFKLEYTAEQAVFIAPKAYACKNINGTGKDKIVVRGIKEGHNLNFEDIASVCLTRIPIKVKQEKLFRPLAAGKITSSETEIKISLTDNNRSLVVNENGDISTTPIILESDKIIEPPSLCTRPADRDNLKIIQYEPARFALLKYTHFIYSDVNIRFLIRVWNRLDVKFPNITYFYKPSLSFWPHILLNYPYTLQEPMYFGTIYCFMRRYTHILYMLLILLK